MRWVAFCACQNLSVTRFRKRLFRLRIKFASWVDAAVVCSRNLVAFGNQQLATVKQATCSGDVDPCYKQGLCSNSSLPF
jgi:hypothetical protein